MKSIGFREVGGAIRSGAQVVLRGAGPVIEAAAPAAAEATTVAEGLGLAGAASIGSFIGGAILLGTKLMEGHAHIRLEFNKAFIILAPIITQMAKVKYPGRSLADLNWTTEVSSLNGLRGDLKARYGKQYRNQMGAVLRKWFFDYLPKISSKPSLEEAKPESLETHPLIKPGGEPDGPVLPLIYVPREIPGIRAPNFQSAKSKNEKDKQDDTEGAEKHRRAKKKGSRKNNKSNFLDAWDTLTKMPDSPEKLELLRTIKDDLRDENFSDVNGSAEARIAKTERMIEFTAKKVELKEKIRALDEKRAALYSENGGLKLSDVYKIILEYAALYASFLVLSSDPVSDLKLAIKQTSGEGSAEGAPPFLDLVDYQLEPIKKALLEIGAEILHTIDNLATVPSILIDLNSAASSSQGVLRDVDFGLKTVQPLSLAIEAAMLTLEKAKLNGDYEEAKKVRDKLENCKTKLEGALRREPQSTYAMELLVSLDAYLSDLDLD